MEKKYFTLTSKAQEIELKYKKIAFSFYIENYRMNTLKRAYKMEKMLENIFTSNDK